MKKNLFPLLIVIFSYPALSQGLSFSYLIPKNGYLSAPVSPFSIRGIGIGGTVGLESGFTLYSMPGLAMSGLPFKSDKPLSGPNWTVLVPGQATFSFRFGVVGIKILGGGFAIAHLNSRLNLGNMDRAIAEHEGWDIASSSLKSSSKLGYGWIAGTEFEFKVSKKFSITTELQYLRGNSKTTITGSYAGGDIGGVIEQKEADFGSPKTNLEGLEISIGVKLQGK
ncbi:MAG: hypothetical protein JXR03_20215 [Cyclobacteriaceae bacterium]